MRGGKELFFKTFASLTEGTILRGGFAVFIPGAGVAKLSRKPPRIPPWRVSTVGYFSYWIETVEQCTRLYGRLYDRLSLCKTVHCSQFLVCPQQATTALYNERGFAKKVRRLANPQKNRHERQRWQSASRAGNGVRGQPPNLVKNFVVSSEFQARLLGHNSQARTRRRKTRRNLRKRRLHGCLFLWPLCKRKREREILRSTCCRETISEFSSDSEVGSVPMPVRRGLKETCGIGSYPLVRFPDDNHGRHRRVNNITLSVTHYGFIDNKSQLFNEKRKNKDDNECLRNNTMSAKSRRTYFRRHNSFLALSHSPLISIINDPRSPRDATAPDLRNDKNVFAGSVSATGSRQGENKNVSGDGEREKKVEEKKKGPSGTHGGPLSHFLSGSRVPPVISHYALATNGDANSVSATARLPWKAARRVVLSVKGGGRGRKNGPFNGLIDLLPRRPTVVMVFCVFLSLPAWHNRHVSYISSTLASQPACRPSREVAAVDFNPPFLPVFPPSLAVARATNPYSYPEEISMESYRKFTVAATRAVGVGESQTGNVCEPLSSTPSCRQSNADTRHRQTPTTTTTTTATMARTAYCTIQLAER
ncbi:hypothetical protein ALC62_13248 [Cyphomyrmex costatus]|uniref:Uncharacterized protein n=1 Tax=Cyphomyrmex costatus TaxID=456900 RepID=A0A195C7Q4_9HYME|nr:hypothetical protein ALC62_13248 [Cyphomyrmex costatus]